MSVFPGAQIRKMVDPKGLPSTRYRVTVMSDDEGPFVPGDFRTLRGVFYRGFRNVLPPETKVILTEALKVAGPVTVTIGWWVHLIERADTNRDCPRTNDVV